MATPDNPQGSSTRPYLLRALHEWCTDNGFTPYIAVHVDASVQVPAEYVKNNEIVLNIGFEATSALRLGNELIEFKARFGGVAREIVVPIDHVVAIYARENGQGMAFPVPAAAGSGGVAVAPGPSAEAPRTGRTKSPPGAAPEPLRLARKGAQSATSTAPAPAPAAKTDEPGESGPPEPPNPGAPRPSLKRVK